MPSNTMSLPSAALSALGAVAVDGGELLLAFRTFSL